MSGEQGWAVVGRGDRVVCSVVDETNILSDRVETWDNDRGPLGILGFHGME